MSRFIALAAPATRSLPAGEVLRLLVVSGCSLALIMAGRALPF